MKYVGQGIWIDEDKIKEELARDRKFISDFIMREIKKGKIKPASDDKQNPLEIHEKN